MIIATHSDSFDKYADRIIDISSFFRRGELRSPDLSGDHRSPLHVGANCVRPITEPILSANITSILPNRKFPQISLKAHSSEIVCLYGANGSGKSLFVRAIAGINKFSFDGSVQWLVDKKKRGICLQFPEHMAYHETVAEEIIDTSGKENLDIVLSTLGWQGRENDSPFTLSDGEKRSMYIVALLAKSEICVFDEPFAGLDAGSITSLAAHFKEAKNSGKSIIYTANRRQDTIFADNVVEIPSYPPLLGERDQG
jgi:energy-coupling factor transporter ATP-binding protein EcfA2